MLLVRALGVVLVAVAPAPAQPVVPPATEIAQVVTLQEAAQAGSAPRASSTRSSARSR